MTDQEYKTGTGIWAVTALIAFQGQILREMGPCPKKSKLERIHHGLRRKLGAWEQAIIDSDRVAERRALKRIAGSITRYDRILITDDPG